MLKFFLLLSIPLSLTFTLDSVIRLLDIQSNKFVINSNNNISNHINLKEFNNSIKNNSIKIIKIKPTNTNTIITKVNTFNFINNNWKKNYSQNKIKFIKTMLPLIAYQNQKIILERKKLLDIKNFLESKNTLSNIDIKYLYKISKKYKLKSNNVHKIDLINSLLKRVEIIPNSIVLAQAANESGWGTSRFAREYNALFGQYTYDEKNGIIPFDRQEGQNHLIKNFSSIDKSVESYFNNINTHYAYEEFRNIRYLSKSNNEDFNIEELTKTLKVYAADILYVDTINSIIKTNNLKQFDLEFNLFIKS